MPSTVKVTLEKKPSVTEDLRLNLVPGPCAKNEEGDGRLERKPLENIREGEVALLANRFEEGGSGGKVVATTVTPSETLRSAGSLKSPTEKPQKTLAELTQEMKSKLNRITEELEKSDKEFDRLVGNLEKKVASLRTKLGPEK